MSESQSDIKNAECLSGYFRDRDNAKNSCLSSSVPELCKKEPCLLGVDEAGRGPVLGPMVYGISYCPLSKADELKSLGFADSKTLTEEQREELFNTLCKADEYIGWAVEAISPTYISNNMLKRQKVSLNQISQDSAVALIQQAIDAGVNIQEVYVDTVGPPEKYQEKLSDIFPDFKITVAKKADATYPIVSAASICAKVSRDRALKIWSFKEGVHMDETAWGSGYPNDPVTKEFLAQNMDDVFGFPQLVRFSWSTASKILQEKAVPVDWEDVDIDDAAAAGSSSILSFFKRDAGRSRMYHQFFQDRKLKSVESI